jgi:hypothetical protein
MVRFREWMAIGVVLVASPSIARAQNLETGVKVGFAVTGVPNAGEVVDQLTKLPSGESTSRVGLAAGGYVRFPINDRFGFQPEAMFVMKGVSITEKNQAGTVDVRLNYIDVPLLIHYKIPLDDTYTAFIVGGPSFGIKMSSSAKLDAPSGSSDVDIDSALKSLDLGIAFGAGVIRSKYRFEFRFTAGMTDIASTSVPHDDSLRNRTFLVLAGMKLP